MRNRTGFLIYRFGGREVLAVPCAARSIRTAGVAALAAATPRARAFRAALRALVAAGVDGALAQRREVPCDAPGGFSWLAFVGAMERALGRDDLEPVILQPRQRARARVYVHLLSPEGERIAFVKLATDTASDVRVANERDALQLLMRGGANTFRFPSLLSAGRFMERQYLLLAPLPARARSHRPQSTERLGCIRAEIAGAPRVLSSLAAASWWPDFVRVSHRVPKLAAELVDEAMQPFTSARAHGDFVNWNVYVSGEDHWVFDWEAFAPDAPLLSDEIRFTLGIHTRAIQAGGARFAPGVLRELGCDDPGRRRDVALALAFLHARDTTTATMLASHWNESVRP